MSKNPRKPRLFNLRFFIRDAWQCLLVPHFFFLFRLKRHWQSKESKAEIKESVPTIYISNHINHLDALVIIQTFWWRRIRFVTQYDLSKKYRLNVWFRMYKCIGVDRRSVATGTFKEINATLEEGYSVGLFPQGRIVRDGEISSFKSGAALIALQNNVRIVPMFITERKGIRNRQEVTIGDSIHPSEVLQSLDCTPENIKMLSDVLLGKMQKLRTMQIDKKIVNNR